MGILGFSREQDHCDVGCMHVCIYNIYFTIRN